MCGHDVRFRRNPMDLKTKSLTFLRKLQNKITCFQVSRTRVSETFQGVPPGFRGVLWGFKGSQVGLGLTDESRGVLEVSDSVSRSFRWVEGFKCSQASFMKVSGWLLMCFGMFQKDKEGFMAFQMSLLGFQGMIGSQSVSWRFNARFRAYQKFSRVFRGLS